MAIDPIVSRPFPRGRTAKGEEIVILTWRDLELFSQMQVRGESYRTYCPIHNSGQERSLSIQAATGFGHCFGCEMNVFVADFDAKLATLLQRQRYGRSPQLESSHSSTASRSKKSCVVREKPAEEWQLLRALHTQGTLGLNRDGAWNGQAYLEARKIPLDLAHRLGVAYIAPGTADQYGEWVRPWEDRLLFPLASVDGMVGFAGRLITHWQCCRDAAAHQTRLHAETLEPWRKTGPSGWFWDPSHLPPQDPVVLVDGPFDRLALLAAGDFEPGEVVALVGTTFSPGWLSQVCAILFALNQPCNSKEAQKQVKQSLAWNGGLRAEMCRPTRGSWSERWRREGAGGLELLYVHHALLTHGI